MDTDSIPVVNDPRNFQNDIDINNIPTSDEDVRVQLRKLGEPITYFGEKASDRRQRLIKIVRELPREVTAFDYEIEGNEEIDDIEDEEDEDEEDYFTPGTQDLYEARIDILKFSLNKAAKRNTDLKVQARNQDLIKVLKHRRQINETLEKIELFGTQTIPRNTRALSSVRFSKDNNYIATGSWDGSITVLNSSDLSIKASHDVKYHTDKISGLDWDIYSDSNLLLSGGGEGNIYAWKIVDDDDEKGGSKLIPQISISHAHDNRITKTLFHPNAKYFASLSFDQTWKLWDINRPETELIQQEGHSQEVFAGSFHPDGSLLATGGLDAIGRLWDLRSGRSIATIQGHIKGIYAMDWSWNGYHLATGSGDFSIKIWDIRKLDHSNSELFSVPIHKKIVSDIRFFNRRQIDTLSKEVSGEFNENPQVLDSNGTFLVTSSYDGTLAIVSCDNWVRVKTLLGHNDKVMSCDISGDGNKIVSSGWDRSVKLWSL
ncbi:WD40-repeat-containing domain protein [Scheffersomyces amazonensis]|uniref:WD40-repeat-containing domain protein n=1 Tax=Scheffersomyces amazonensis TaxID=1078765 RepID=UPI00315D3C23